MKNVTLSIPDDLLAKAREYAKQHGTSLNEMIRELLRKNVTKQEDDFRERLEKLRRELAIDSKIKFDRDEIYKR